MHTGEYFSFSEQSKWLEKNFTICDLICDKGYLGELRKDRFNPF